MKAVRVHQFGGGVHVDEVAEPLARDTDVLIRVRHIAVNPLDLWVSQGTVAGGDQHLPFVVGTEAVADHDGHLVLVHGAGIGVTRDGLCRELADVPLTACTPLPGNIDPRQAAAAAVAGVTAWRLVHELTETTASDVALVLGASGGVGSLLVQVLRDVGCRVVAQTSSEKKRCHLTDLGADEVIVTSAETLPELEPAPSVIFDPLGGPATARAMVLLGPFGRHALFGTSQAPTAPVDLRAFYRKAGRLLGYSQTIDPPSALLSAMIHVLDQLAAGRLRVPIDEVLPLDRAPEAHRRLQQRSVRGKVILDVT
ncbi:MAG: quinone oxidoreductase family protein [Candidatus Dormibacteria bacterium]